MSLFICPSCKKEYVRKHYLDKHINQNKCKVALPTDKIQEELKDWIKQEITDQLTKYGIIRKPKVHPERKTIINRVAFGEEDLSKLSQEDNIDIFNSGVNSYQNFIYTIHYSGKYPEYENIVVDPVSNQLYVYNGNGKWEKESTDFAAKQIYQVLMRHLKELANNKLFLKQCDPDWMIDTLNYIRLSDFDKEAPRIINAFKNFRRGMSISDEEYLSIV